MKNNLITGIPRSGTSLISSLIANNTQSVVFSEPNWLKAVRDKSDDCSQFVNNFITKIINLKHDILNGHPIRLKYDKKNLSIPSNYYQRNEHGELIVDKNEVDVVFDTSFANRPFFIKANAQFTSCIKSLIKSNQFNIYCIVRNPISCIMSWRSLNIPVSHGKMKVAEKYSSSFHHKINGAKSLLDKQSAIIDWYFEVYSNFSDHVSIIRYEDLIVDTGTVLNKILKSNPKHIPQLKSNNHSSNYQLDEVKSIQNALKKTEGYYKKFYSEI